METAKLNTGVDNELPDALQALYKKMEQAEQRDEAPLEADLNPPKLTLLMDEDEAPAKPKAGKWGLRLLFDGDTYYNTIPGEE